MQPISQTFVPISPPVCGIGPLGLCSGDSENETIRLTAALISTAIGLLTVIAALFFLPEETRDKSRRQEKNLQTVQLDW